MGTDGWPQHKRKGRSVTPDPASPSSPPAAPPSTGAAGGATNGPRVLLRRCASRRFERAEAEWRQLLSVLRMPLAAYPAVRIILRQARWKNATDPITYVRRAAWREARRLGLVDEAGPPTLIVPPGIGHDQYIDWLAHQEQADTDDDSPMRRVDHDLVCAGDTADDDLDVDWDAVAQRAGLDAAELALLKRRAKGSARAELPLEDQAVWRRVHRKLLAVRAALHGAANRP